MKSCVCVCVCVFPSTIMTLITRSMASGGALPLHKPKERQQRLLTINNEWIHYRGTLSYFGYLMISSEWEYSRSLVSLTATLDPPELLISRLPN
jgi:hypothetical protein